MSKAEFDGLKVEMWVGSSMDEKAGVGGWAVHMHSCVTGQHTTKTKAGYCEEATSTRLILKAIVEGLYTIKKPVMLHIYTDQPNVSRGINQFLGSWHKNNYKTQTGEDLKHMDLWMQIHEMLLGPQSLVMAYKVHYKKESPIPENNILVVHTASRYAARAKKQISEVAFDVA